jgi:phenylalanyl-tRNA synthetase beta chain
MKMSIQWLREWVSFDKSPQEIAATLTMSGLEVDEMIPAAGEFSGVIVAEVLSTEPHPQADKLTLCRINTGSGEPIQVVCGAQNVRAGLKVALATVGAILPEGFHIKQAKLRGEMSNGMLCSSSELGMADTSEGIIELPHDAPVGEDFRTYFQLNDTILSIDLTPNRGDCLSVYGVARELAAQYRVPLKAWPESSIQITGLCSVQVVVEEPQACPLYVGCTIKGLQANAATPWWIQEYLRRSGIRSINLVVDVTQYVMLEMGQPLHAFDLNHIQQPIQVRMSQPEESLQLLDGQTAQLDASLLIADQQGPLAIAGVMGGLASAVSHSTTDVFLESAFFTPRALAQTARKYGLNTDAAYRFERGVDPSMTERALRRACQLITTYAGGQISEPVMSRAESPYFDEQWLTFYPDDVKKKLGVTIPEDQMIQILTSLGFYVENLNPQSWRVRVPPHRFDVAIKEDLLEEIIRVYGYDHLPASATVTTLKAGHTHWIEKNHQRMATILMNLGYREVINYSFVDPKLQHLLHPQAPSLALLNPLSPELSHMRVSLWPGLLASMLYNLNRQHDGMALFEVGRVFQKSASENILVEESTNVAGLLTGTPALSHWAPRAEPFDFFHMKGHLEHLFRTLDIHDVQWQPMSHEVLHPGQSAQLIRQGQVIGWCGMMHPKLNQALDVQHDVFLFELDVAHLQSSEKSVYRTLSKYPKIRRDCAFLVDRSRTLAEILSEIQQANPDASLRQVELFDVYEGPGIPEGMKSMALAFHFQHDEKTLTEDDIQKCLNPVIDRLKAKLSMILRDGQ